MAARQNFWPAAGLLYSATVWGLAWYALRLLADAGIDGARTSVIAYSFALLILLLLRPGALRAIFDAPGSLFLMAAAAAWSNYGYVLGVIDGEVMRVSLLFYLSPFWTIFFARLFLNERLSAAGWLVMLASLTGMFIILWRPGGHLPVPESTADWLGLSAGIGFALSSVLSRRAAASTLLAKSYAVCLSMVLMGLLLAPFLPPQAVAVTATHVRAHWPLLALVGSLALTTNLAVQYGFRHVAANQAMVIFLFELVVTSTSSALLAHEYLSLHEWIGGLLIVSAGLLSTRASGDEAGEAGQPRVLD